MRALAVLVGHAVLAVAANTFRSFFVSQEKNMWKRVFILIFIVVLVVEAWLWFNRFHEETPSPVVVVGETKKEAEEAEVKEEIVPPIVTPPREITETIKYTVPFVPQAPTGDWSKSAFQDGCEEASTMMVSLARSGKTLTREEMRLKLLDMARFQTEQIGHGVDTDVADTYEYLLKQYFEITDARVVTDVTLEDVKQALLDGLVIVPTNGRALGNPNFTPPGPLQHMLVIIGYDIITKEFITNDPGTRLGQGYRYPEQVLYDAIREYPTGKHLPVTTGAKSMIVVSFEQNKY